MTESELTGFCGLYCGDCIRYRSKASDLAKELLGEFEKTRFSEYARVKRSQVPELDSYELAVSVLTGVSRLTCEIPCRLGGDGCAGSCLIIKCVSKHKSFRAGIAAHYRWLKKMGKLNSQD